MYGRIALLLLSALFPAVPPGSLIAQESPRARDLGIPFDGEPGPLNAITDVAGVEVGHVTLIEGEGPLVVLLHSGGMSGRQWRRLAGLLSASYRVVTPDFLGSGDNQVQL